MSRPLTLELVRSCEERFLSYVEKTETCWLWTGCLDSYGYGVLRVGGANVKAHRLSWMLANGEIPTGMCLCHTCDVRRCVSLGHLFLGTNQANIADRHAKGRTKGVPHGAEHPNSKLTPDAVLEIRRMRSLGATYKEMAQRFGVHHSAIGDICRGRNWSWLQ